MKAMIARLLIWIYLLSMIPPFIPAGKQAEVEAGNSYTGGAFQIATSTTVTGVSGLTALKGSFLAVTDTIYVDSGATLTVDSSISCIKIYLGQARAGAVAAGQRYGILTINPGVTVTFAGNATSTNSGVQANPTSADASSKGCALNVNGTSGSMVTFTNDGNALDANKRWTFSLNYGQTNIQYANLNYAYGSNFTALPTSSATCNTGPIINNCVISTQGTAANMFTGAPTTGLDIISDLRFNTYTNSAINATIYATTTVAPGTGKILLDGFKIIGASTGNITPYVCRAATDVYINGKFSGVDIRPTTVTPTGLTFTNLQDGTVKYKISNIASYRDSDEIVIYDSNNVAQSCIPKARYVASLDRKPDSCGIIAGVPLQALTKWRAKATSDNSTYSAASDTATRTTITFKPAANQTLSGVGFGQNATEFTGNLTLPGQSQVQSGITYGGSGTDSTGSLTGGTSGDCIQRKRSFKNY